VDLLPNLLSDAEREPELRSLALGLAHSGFELQKGRLSRAVRRRRGWTTKEPSPIRSAVLATYR